jgi:hypothetical protein
MANLEERNLARSKKHLRFLDRAIQEGSRSYVDASSVDLTLSLIEALSRRVSELGRTALEMAFSGRTVAAAVLTRAVVESVAVLNSVRVKVNEALDSGDFARLGSSIEKLALGSRMEFFEERAVNVLTHVDRMGQVEDPEAFVDKMGRRIHSFRTNYDFLSDATHPNWVGTLGSYSMMVKKPGGLSIAPGSGDAVGALRESCAVMLRIALARCWSMTVMLFRELGKRRCPAA